MRDSKIEWTTHTFNPWWGCAKVSPGCAHCYAESLSKRYGRAVWGVEGTRPVASETYWKQPLKWNREAEGAADRPRVFCASMADVFEDRRDLDAPRERLWALIEATPNLDWLLLTKRPENMVRLTPERWRGGWPGNVWAGTTTEDQKRVDVRVPVLLDVPARIRFLSVEPQVSPVELLPYFADSIGNEYEGPHRWAPLPDPGIHWVIQGGESGPGARPFQVAWARDLRDQCKAAGVAYHLKQLGARPHDPSVRAEGQHDDRVLLKSAKGGDWSEWPEDLRVREYPTRPLSPPPGREA